MNGPQDMGGATSFGPVVPEPEKPVFHAAWEARVLALTLAMGATGTWNIDTSRHARERLPPITYWSKSYYEIWFEGLNTLLKEHGLVPESRPVKRVLKAEMVPAVLARGAASNRPSAAAARFKIGDRVRARNINPRGHTRSPRYARGRLGEIVTVHGAHVFPDSSAHGRGDDPQWLYNVRFSARELWGSDCNDCVHIDLWEPYLEAA